MNCNLCKGEGQILILAYTTPRIKEIIFKDRADGIVSDCPKCNGTGKAIE